MTSSFADLGVPARMCEALAAQGMTEPFAVQAITLPDALAGRDLCGRAPTGSGKTLGFGIPLMARVSQAEPKRPTGLVLVPTRELAEQVQRAFVPLGRAQWRFVQAVYGGAPMSTQIHSLKKGASVVVATPGRLLDLIDQGHCDLSAVEVCVIDEADRMADLGFMPDVKRILDLTPETRQTMLWSATLDGDVDELVRTYLREPVMHDLVGEVAQGDVEHRFVVHPAMQRLEATVELIERHGPAIVFVKTRFGVDDVTAALMNAGVRAGSLHGARTQQARTRTLADFQRGKVQVLVATDVAARGIHVDDVDLVVHYDLPDNDKDYQHRSGRTGRAGRDGTVVAFVPPSRQRVARRLIDDLDHEVTWVDGDRTPRAERPRFDRDSRPARDERPRFDRDSRPARDDRPRFDRSDRPARDDRSSRRSFDRMNDRGERPARDDRPARPWQDRDDRTDRGPRRDGDRPWSRDDFRDGRSDRPERGRRAERDARFERAATGRPAERNDRFERTDRFDARPARAGAATGERRGPARADRPARPGRPAGPARRPR
ncbi:MAG: DEAD/DEAH box helicase [Acidimicrobiales bacterium]